MDKFRRYKNLYKPGVLLQWQGTWNLTCWKESSIDSKIQVYHDWYIKRNDILMAISFHEVDHDGTSIGTLKALHVIAYNEMPQIVNIDGYVLSKAADVWIPWSIIENHMKVLQHVEN